MTGPVRLGHSSGFGLGSSMSSKFTARDRSRALGVSRRLCWISCSTARSHRGIWKDDRRRVWRRASSLAGPRGHAYGYFHMSRVTEVSETGIWIRVIQPEKGDLSPEAAREWLRLRLSNADIERVRDLSQKADDGTLTQEEERELDTYLNVGGVLELLKAKARLSLSKTKTPV
jgi:uncharacterized protein YnzC (UPF0291/DUF896 family)